MDVLAMKLKLVPGCLRQGTDPADTTSIGQKSIGQESIRQPSVGQVFIKCVDSSSRE